MKITAILIVAILFLFLLISLTHLSCKNQIYQTGFDEPEDPVIHDLTEWQNITPGLHSSFGSTNKRYLYHSVPVTQKINNLKGTLNNFKHLEEKIENAYNFKTPLNVAIADHQPERLFIREFIKPESAQVLDSWVKSTDQDFYPIEYSWKKGEHPKRGRFNPDFFIKVDTNILVVEIKGDEEIKEPSDENKAKYKAAKKHFKILNEQQSELNYFFNFLTPEDYDYYFDQLHKKNFEFISKLDAELEKNGDEN